MVEAELVDDEVVLAEMLHVVVELLELEFELLLEEVGTASLRTLAPE